MTVHFEDVTHQPTTVACPANHTYSLAEKSMPLFTITAPSLQMLIQDEGRFKPDQYWCGAAGRWMYRRCTVPIELSVTQRYACD
jgi:hypothetical protein